MNLQTYRIVEPWTASMFAAAASSLALRVIEAFGVPTRFGWIWLCIAVLGGGLIAWLLKRVAILDVENKMLFVEIQLHDWIISRRIFDLSQCSWVRARLPDDDIKRIVIEAGTRAYETTALVKVPFKSKAGIPEAIDLCGKISAALAVENWGYKVVT